MPSTAIRSFEYRPQVRELEITFTTGRRYIYFGVPEDVVNEFRVAPSKGICFNKQIRPFYRFREIAPAGA
jgi:lysyl-tRNA synthetase class 2